MKTEWDQNICDGGRQFLRRVNLVTDMYEIQLQYGWVDYLNRRTPVWRPFAKHDLPYTGHFGPDWKTVYRYHCLSYNDDFLTNYELNGLSFPIPKARRHIDVDLIDHIKRIRGVNVDDN